MNRQSKIACLVLAAGLSRRFGADDKLLAEIEGRAVIDLSLAAYQSAAIDQRIAVVPPDSPLNEHCVAAGFETCTNPQPERGMGHSIACGMAALRGTDISHVLIGLADMPKRKAATVEQICRASGQADSIALPLYKTQHGHPRLFAAQHFAQLAALDGPNGARDIIAACPDIYDVAVDDAGIGVDIDTPEDLAELS